LYDEGCDLINLSTILTILELLYYSGLGLILSLIFILISLFLKYDGILSYPTIAPTIHITIAQQESVSPPLLRVVMRIFVKSMSLRLLSIIAKVKEGTNFPKAPRFATYTSLSMICQIESNF